MKITFIGTGSAFTLGGNFQSNMLLQSASGARLLIDCGSDCRHGLFNLGLSYRDLSTVFISHLHADHIGGLEWLGFTHKFDPTMSRPKLLISDKLVDDLWQHSLMGGMRSLAEEQAQLNTYFDTQLIKDIKTGFTWEDIQFELVTTEHVYHGEQPMPCYGLFFTINNTNVYITGDTRYSPEKLQPWYDRADVIFHDCELGNAVSGVHAHYNQLVTLPESIKRKMWLYHYQPLDLPDAVAAGFHGFVKTGAILTF